MSGGTELDRIFYTVDADIAPFKKKIAELDGDAAKAGNNLSDHFNKGAKGAHELHRGIEVSRRELLYAGRELATGDWARLPSTLGLIASHMVGMTSAGILMGGALAAPLIAMGLAAYQSERAMTALETSIRRVGSATGVTPGQVLMMAQGQSIPGVSMNGALSMSAALLARGNVSGVQLPAAIQASSLYSKAEGLSDDKGAAAFERILADPAKGAVELHDAMKLLSSSQMEQIDHLQREGDLRGAQNIIIAATTARLSTLNDNAGPLAKTFEKMGKEAASWWDRMGHVVALRTGLTNITPEEALANVKAELARRSAPGYGKWGSWGALPIDVEGGHKLLETDALKALRDKLQKQVDGGQAAAAQGGALDAADERRRQFLDKMRGIDPQFGRRADLTDDNSLLQKVIADKKGAIADPRTTADARKQALADIAEAQRGITANNWAIRTGKSPSQFLSVDGDPVARRQAELAFNAKGQMGVAGAYGQSVVAGRNAELELRADEAIRKKEIYASGRGAFIASGQADDAERHAKGLADTILKMQDENALLTKRAQLMGVDEDVRNKQLAQQEAINRITEEYGDLSTTAAKNALAATLKEVDAKQDLLKTIKDINDEQQAQLDMAHDLTDVIESPLKKLMGKNPLLQLFGKYALFDPLENAIQGSVTGTPGTKPTLATAGGLFGKLFGGIGGVGGKPDGSPMNPLHVVMSAASSAGSSISGGLSNLMKAGGTASKMWQGSWLQTAASAVGSYFGFANGGAWSGGGVRYAANGMVLGGATMFSTGSGPVIGGELGKNSEALMPLARGPGGVLGVRAHGAMARAPIHVHQSIAIHPDVSSVARGEIIKMIPMIKTEAVSAVSEAMARGVPMGA